MKKILIPEVSGKMHHYRANLHCHSSISDGKKSVEELKDFYKSHGYSILAYTDHNVYLLHNDLTDDDFLALNGVEFDVSSPMQERFGFFQTCHINMIAYEPDNDVNVCYDSQYPLWGNAEKYREFQKPLGGVDYKRSYNAACISDIMKRGRENGFFVTYNHPTWSLEFYPEFTSYKNMDAMEIVNFGCVMAGYDDDNGHCYEDMLRTGSRIFCIATDDNHNWRADDSPECDSFGGATVIAAPKLEYRAVTEALKNGLFYATSGTSTHNGPEIKSLVYEDGTVTIRTSPCRTICYMPNSRACRINAARDGETVTEATFKVADGERWFRLTATDREGYKAYTNAYFPDSLK